MNLKRKNRLARWWDYLLMLCVLALIGAILWNSQRPNAIPFIAQTAPSRAE